MCANPATETRIKAALLIVVSVLNSCRAWDEIPAALESACKGDEVLFTACVAVFHMCVMAEGQVQP